MNGRAEGSMRIVSIMGQTCSTCVSYCTVGTANAKYSGRQNDWCDTKPISLREQAHN